MDGFPTFTPDEAKAVIPRLRPLLARLRETFHEYRFALAQRDELHALHGDALAAASHPDHAEWRAWNEKTTKLRAQTETLVKEANALGADVKDPILGLVDFYAQRGNDLVLLCYRDDEDTITHWHPVETGFAGRRPLSEL